MHLLPPTSQHPSHSPLCHCCLPPPRCCRYKEEVDEQGAAGEGCHLWGRLHINKARTSRGRGRGCWGGRPLLPCSKAAARALPSLHRPPPPPHPRLTASNPLRSPFSLHLQVAGNFHFAPGRSYQQGQMHIHDL